MKTQIYDLRINDKVVRRYASLRL